MKKNRPLLGLLFLILLGCSESPPEIKQMDWRIIYRDQGFRREELLIFLHVSDPDDETDPNDVTVIAQGTGFQWQFPRSQWIPAKYENIDWWGMPAITPYNGDRLPDAVYLVRLTDLGGKSTEMSIRPSPSRTQPINIDWPTVNVKKNILQYSGKAANPLLILRTSDYKVTKKTNATNGYDLSNTGAAWWEIWINTENTSSGIRIGPYALPAK